MTNQIQMHMSSAISLYAVVLLIVFTAFLVSVRVVGARAQANGESRGDGHADHDD